MSAVDTSLCAEAADQPSATVSAQASAVVLLNRFNRTAASSVFVANGLFRFGVLQEKRRPV
jgi:hypothetical protein